MTPYSADYYLRGKQSGLSLYEDYRWLPDLTIPMVRSMIAHLGILPHHKVMDFGCARGYSVRAFLELGIDAWGIDASEWAVANADETIPAGRVICGTHETLREMQARFDWVVAKDVLEHLPYVFEAVQVLKAVARVGVFAVVPLSPADGCPYVVPEYELDVTHVQRKTLDSWVEMFLEPGWDVTASYRVPGVKDNYSQFATGNGFITCQRL